MITKILLANEGKQFDLHCSDGSYMIKAGKLYVSRDKEVLQSKKSFTDYEECEFMEVRRFLNKAREMLDLRCLAETSA